MRYKDLPMVSPPRFGPTTSLRRTLERLSSERRRRMPAKEYRKFKPRICPNVRYWKLCQIDKRGETRPLLGRVSANPADQ